VTLFTTLNLSHICWLLIRLKQYHLDSVEAFEAYKQMYTDEVMPLLAGQKPVEATLQEAEPRAALDAEVMHCFMYDALSDLDIQLYANTCQAPKRRRGHRPFTICLTLRNVLPVSCTSVCADTDVIQRGMLRLLKTLSKGFVSSLCPANCNLSLCGNLEQMHPLHAAGRQQAAWVLLQAARVCKEAAGMHE